MKIAKKISLLVFFCFVGLNCYCNHPFYVSICQVDFNKNDQSLEISVKIFADDLVKALETMGTEKIFLGEKKENKKTDQYIAEYLRNNLKFWINDSPKNYTFLGKEMESDVLWIYLEIRDINTLKGIEVECKLLTEMFSSQNNIIHVNNGNSIKSLLLNNKKYRDEINYN